MKILCTCVPALGHLYPMVPMARALCAAGHEVVFATAREFHHEVAACGLAAMPAGYALSALRRSLEKTRPDFSALAADQQAALLFMEAEPRSLRDNLLPLAREWQPDLLVHEEAEFGGPIVATLLNIPAITLGWPAPARPGEMMKRLHHGLAPLWMESGLEPAPMGGLYRDLFLDLCPPSLQTSPARKFKPRVPVRPVIYNKVAKPQEYSWLEELPARPTIHVTLGTVPLYNQAPHLYKAIIEGLASEDINLIISVGENNDPDALSFPEDRVRVEKYIPHSVLLPYCDLVICHGGCGSTIGALTHGLPLLIIPQGGAAQKRNAIACVQIGAAQMLAYHEATPSNIRQAYLNLLNGENFKREAVRIAKEIEGMPPPQKAVECLEQLVMEKKGNQD